MPLKIKTFDVALFIAPIIFMVTSVAVIYSLVFQTTDESLAYKQGIIAMIGMALMAITCFADYRFFKSTSWMFYLLGMALLIIANVAGRVAGGAQSWLSLGFFQLQPSELSKVFLIFSLSAFFSNKIGQLRWKDIFISVLILTPMLGLILTEPDFGSGLVVVFIYLVLLFSTKPSKSKMVMIIGLVGAISMIILLSSMNIAPFKSLLRDYQRERIVTFFQPDLDPYGSGYNVRQAQISVGSGGLLGKGLGRGSQSQLQFLPEPHTDFIFAGISESFGFLGAGIFLILYFYLILRILSIAFVAQENFGMLVCLGAAAMFIFQVLINIGMNLGLAPITGITLPFLSYGGTSLIISLFMIGIVQSIFIRHKKISF
ncbi:MAG: rod shape-determining protein RodA [Patescibacteria group bacterium]